MRILVATDLWFPDFRGGAARVARATARELAARGHEVTVLAPVKPGSPKQEASDGFVLLRSLWRGPIPQTATDVITSRRLVRRLGEHYDVLLAHQVTTACGFAAARTTLPLVLVCHGSPAREARLDADELPFGKRRIERLAIGHVLGQLERIAVKRARRLIVLSDYMAALLSGDFPSVTSRVRVARGGVDSTWLADHPGHLTARDALAIPRSGTLVLAVRRLERGLGLENVLRAFRLLVDRREATLALVGGGSLAPRLQALGDELGLGPRLRLPGPQDGEALRHWYRAADLFVLPPKPLEGFGMATVEALASGTPPVVARVGANPEILEPLDPRLIARSDEPTDLAATMAAALELAGPDLRRRCREYAFARFTWDRVMPDWEEVLVDAVRTHS